MRGSTAFLRKYSAILAMLFCLLLIACSEANPSGPRAEVTQSTAPPPAISTADSRDLVPTAGAATNEVAIRDYILGPEDAYVTIIMYGDFQCVRCARYARDLEILRAEFADDLRLVWRHLPDTQSNDKAALALSASEAAAAQGRFWDMHAILYTTQGEWASLPVAEFRQRLIAYAQTAGLDVGAFTEAIDDGRFLPLVEQYQIQAADLGIVGIPTLLVNGELLSDRDDLFGLEGAVRLALLSQYHFNAPPPMTIDISRDYQAVIVTERGEIRLNLFEKDTPLTVNNFVFLAEQGWYDGTTFFLVVPDFYAQAGDPSATGRGHPGYRIAGEYNNGYIFDRAGLVAMSHPPGEPDNAGSQFLITFGPLPEHETEWDGQYTIFGVVTAGLDIVQALTPRNPGDPLRFPNPPPGDRIIEIRIEVQ
jgi:cyclophilin family peptidyl-prolyl cis-trans isomerase/protein-disulfide isomerase